MESRETERDSLCANNVGFASGEIQPRRALSVLPRIINLNLEDLTCHLLYILILDLL